jgi:hypothetical protein
MGLAAAATLIHGVAECSRLREASSEVLWTLPGGGTCGRRRVQTVAAVGHQVA